MPDQVTVDINSVRLFTFCSNHRYNSDTKISAVTGQIAHGNIVADAFCSMRSFSALLFRDLQALQRSSLANVHSIQKDEYKKM